MNKSIWIDSIKQKDYKKLDKNIEADVLIIGGGITGISTAYHLINKNKKVVLVEKNKLLSGITSKTTGKLTYLQEDIYQKLKKNFNLQIAKQYLESQIEAINIVVDTIEKEKIDCNLEKADSYIFTNSNQNLEKIDKEKGILKELGIHVENKKILPNNEKVKESIKVTDTYVFNPLKYLNELIKICSKNKIDIYENTKIEKIEEEKDILICKTKQNIIKAKKVVLALHYPYFLKPLFIPLKTTLEKSYIHAKEIEKSFNFNAINLDTPKISIRYHKDKNKKYKIELTNTHNIAFKNNEKENFEHFDPKDYNWSNIDIITNDDLPYIGKISNNLLIGTGYNAWGMTNGNLAGKILSNIICNKKNKYENLFAPKRKINLPMIINFPITLISTTKSFIGSKINKNKSWYEHVKFENRNGKSIGIYSDKDNIEHKVYNICPHLKCSLIFNEVEKTWDCPCHGSRFNIDGKSIEGPSNYDISYKE